MQHVTVSGRSDIEGHVNPALVKCHPSVYPGETFQLYVQIAVEASIAYVVRMYYVVFGWASLLLTADYVM